MQMASSLYDVNVKIDTGMKDLKSKNYRTPLQSAVTVTSAFLMIFGVFTCLLWLRDLFRSLISDDYSASWGMLFLGVGTPIAGLIMLCRKGKINDREREGTSCLECQNIVRPGTKYCTWCGAKIPENPQITTGEG